MKKIIFAVFSVLFFTGCATEFSATGGPAVLANVFNDLRNQGVLKTSPGGFVERNKDAGLGVLINKDQAVSKDVEIFVQGEGDIWNPYLGPAMVYTPGWIKEYDNEKKKWFWKKLSSRWLAVDGLEAIHFESAFMQSVTLRTSSGEIYFETEGRRETSNSYERINILFIKLPLNQYRFNVYSYTGMLLKKVEGQHTRYLYINSNPTDYRVGNIWVGWELDL